MKMKGIIALTDKQWYETLRDADPKCTEVNFWRPSPKLAFQESYLDPFLFKLKSPDYDICGFAYRAKFSALPLWLAWETYKKANGCKTRGELEQRIKEFRDKINYSGKNTDLIGCELLVAPVFFPRKEWVRPPDDWLAPIQQGKGYDLTVGEGLRVWEDCQAVARKLYPDSDITNPGPSVPFGSPSLVASRLGQGAFRIAVTDAYGRACAVTGERVLAALDAAHIRPVAAKQDHRTHSTSNGLLLRADLHRLFDRGYITVDRDLKLVVSARLQDVVKGGQTHYPSLHGTPLRKPQNKQACPDLEMLCWHEKNVFKA